MVIAVHAGVGVGGVLLSVFLKIYMCPTVECILCNENVYTAHCMRSEWSSDF